MRGFKKRHALIGLLLFAVTAFVGRVRHRMEAESDEWASQLVEARERIRWLEMRLAKRSGPPAARMADSAVRKAAAPEKNTDQEDVNGEIAAKAQDGESNPYGLKPDPMYGPFKPLSLPVAEGRITLSELSQLEKLPPIEVGDYVLKARLLNAAGEELAAMELPGGQRGKIEHIQEFPRPTAFDPPQSSPDGKTYSPSHSLPVTTGQAGSFPVTPAVPTMFDFKNTGWTIDVEMRARGGLLVVTGLSQQIGFEGFTAQPGETGKPIYDDRGTLLSDNKQLQPTFTTRESPFTFDMLPGKTYRLPLPSGNEGTVLEFAPVPAE